jgi:hypothetical protein
MQSDGTVGRVLLASLHQAIGEVLPARLEFYEPWLQPPDHPDEALRIAPFGAMLSALQQEDDSQHVIARAGQYAAIRSVEQLSALRRAGIRVLPRRIRARKAVGLIVRILPALYADARIDVTRRGGTIFIGIEGSPFCTPIGRPGRPSCHFYSNAVTTFLQLFKLSPAVRVSRCRESGTPSCLLTVLPCLPRGGAGIGTVLPGLTDDVMAPDLPTPDLPLVLPEPELEAPAVLEAPAALEAVEPDAAVETEPATSPAPVERRAIEARWDALFLPQVPGKDSNQRDTGRTPSDPGDDPESPWHRL